MNISIGFDSEAFKHPTFDAYIKRGNTPEGAGLSGFYVSLLGFEFSGFIWHRQRKVA